MCLRWGDPAFVPDRFGSLADDIQFDRRSVRLEFGSLEEASAFWERFNGPQIALRNFLPGEQYAEMLQELNTLTATFNRADDGSVRIDSEWMLAVARKPD
jgi:hypothetical protein